ncbi:MAG: hypothetical protein JWQ12_116 [Glaciihabitans sp.]|nr:hypothetical protein [Glaciihabitans sp.]
MRFGYRNGTSEQSIANSSHSSWFTPVVKLEPTGGDAVEMSVREIAELYWQYHFASVSPLRAERLRTEGGDLQNAYRLLEQALEADDHFDELIVEMISVLHDQYPEAEDGGLGYLAAGPIEEHWNSGDTEILTRMRRRGISAKTLAQIEGGIWKREHTPPKPRSKPRHPK